MRCIVTGAAGFVGSHLVEALLRNNHDVLGIDCFVDYYPRQWKEANLARARDFRQFVFVEADLRTADLASLFDGAEAVFHLAAQAGVRASWGDEFSSYTGHNILATQRVLEAAKSSGVQPTLKKVVYASSSSVYGQAESLPTRESALPHPISPYGVSKLAAEHLMVLYSREFAVPTASLRYFTVYGPRQRPDMAFHRFARAALEDKLINIFDDGQQSRDFTYVTDAVAATMAAASSEVSPLVCNIGGGSRVTINRVLETMEEIIGRPVRRTYGPRQAGDARHTSADTSIAERELCFRPEVNLYEGLKNEIEWMDQRLSRNRARVYLPAACSKTAASFSRT